MGDMLDEVDYISTEQWNYILNRQRNFDRFYRSNKTNELKEIIPMKNMNKFYVGAGHIGNAIANNRNDDWTHKTEAQAIAHAKRILEDENKDVVCVVEIKYIVRRATQPIKVERVK